MADTDLLVIVEGRRDEEVLRAVLERGRQLRIRQITFEFLRRAGAVYTEGPEIAQLEKHRFDKVILLWDHADSQYANHKPNRAQGIVQAKLNERTLKNCSKAIAVDPELEIWLWQDKSAIAKALGVSIGQINQWIMGRAVTRFPKETLEWVCKQVNKKPDAALWGKIACLADLKLWEQCYSFRLFCKTLRKWFP